jgi:hypothetical protein
MIFFPPPTAKSSPESRAERIRRLIRWHGWRMIEMERQRYAFINADESDRAPGYGSYSIDEAEKFLAARDREGPGA